MDLMRSKVVTDEVREFGIFIGLYGYSTLGLIWNLTKRTTPYTFLRSNIVSRVKNHLISVVLKVTVIYNDRLSLHWTPSLCTRFLRTKVTDHNNHTGMNLNREGLSLGRRRE